MTAAPLLAGVDAGTTRIRALLFEPDGTIAAEGSMATPTVQPRPGWAHHEAEALWRATADALRQATAKIDDPGRIAGNVNAFDRTLAPVIDHRLPALLNFIPAGFASRGRRDLQ